MDIVAEALLTSSISAHSTSVAVWGVQLLLSSLGGACLDLRCCTASAMLYGGSVIIASNAKPSGKVLRIPSPCV